jgi:putative phosphoesterase
MRIVVISDTHIPHRAKDLPAKLWEEIEKADLVIHAGDYTSFDFYTELTSVAEVRGVYGNMDEYRLTEILPEKEILEVEGKRIGIFHGFGAPLGLEKRVRKKFENDKVDIIIYGHSHRAVLKEEDNLLIINPGSPTDKIFTRYLSYAILEIEGGRARAEIIKL